MKMLLVVTALLIGCSAKPTKETLYPYYVLDVASSRLNAKEAKDDRPLDTCRSIGTGKYKCVVMITDDFFAMKEELRELRARDYLSQKYCIGLSSGDDL
jgi:hypothetical protein